MIGLKSIPTVQELLKAYELLQTHSIAIPVADLVLWTQWTRLDPRLGEQWIVHLASHWKGLSPIEFNEHLKRSPWPAAAGPLLETLYAFSFLDQTNKALFKNWMNCVMSGIEPASNEQYFIGLYAFASALLLRDAVHSLTPFRRWGYYSQEVLLNKARKSLSGKSRTLLPHQSRRALLNELIKKQETIRSQDYIELLKGCIGRRQAELDLKKHPKLKPVGNTKARYYKRMK